jgi:serine/threonine protein kinase
MPDAITHPTRQELTAFGQGHLAEAAATAVAGHLEVCASCRQVVESLPPDSVTGKVRASRPTDSSLPPGRAATLLGATSATPPDVSASPASPAGLPPELTNHPRYRILRELGRGGMGVVYRAVQILMERHVAIKVINPSVLAYADALPRFQSEVKAAARLDHPNIVRAYDAEQVGGMHLLVMEYVEGTNLANLVQRKGPLPVALACHFIRQAALGLHHAYEQGMVHRDIKPQNLMVTPKGVVKILDFGLARLRGGGRGGGITEAGSFMGTPEYVAPEQAADARAADTRSDIYSLGCTLFFLLTGRPPFVEETPVKLVLAHIEKPPPSVTALRPEVPPALAAVLVRMLAKDPAARYPQPAEVAQALVAFIKAGTKPAAPAADAKETNLPPGPARQEETPEPFAALADATAPAERPKKPRAPAWYRRPSVLAGAGSAVLAAGLGISLVVGGVFSKPKARDTGPGTTVGEPDTSRKRPALTADGFESLINEKGLYGWFVERGDNRPWSVEQEAIVAHGEWANGENWKTANYLLSDREFADFILRLEFNLEADASSALALRAIPGENNHPHISLADSNETGMTHWLRDDTWVSPDRPAETKWAGEWNQLEVEVRGHTLRLTINGRPVVYTILDAPGARCPDGSIPGLNRARGRIGLQKYRGTARFRNIQIKELRPE